jgi:hypothetical protein
MGVRVSDLLPGDRVTQGADSAVFVAQTEHPLWPDLRLVVWRLANGMWSHDALSPAQDVGEMTPSTADERKGRLQSALLGGDHRA